MQHSYRCRAQKVVARIGLSLLAALLTALLAGCSLKQTHTSVGGPVGVRNNNRSLFAALAAPKRTVGVGAEKSHATHPTEKRVLALYYPWYQTPQVSGKWAHQTSVDPAHKRLQSHAHYPAQGPYDSADPAVIDRHLAQAEKAGIDTLVCSWWGPDDPTDAALRQLVVRAEQSHVKICILWEQYAGLGGEAELERNLTYLLRMFGPQPAYLKVDNRPVVFVYERVRHSAGFAAWSTALNNVTRNFAPGVFIVGDGKTESELQMWDGLYSLPAADRFYWSAPEAYAQTQHDMRHDLIVSARQWNRISVASLMPGYDDRKYNALSHLHTQTFLDRRDGSMYRAQWQQAIQERPDWILINSFNQWHAGTEIEPSVEMGDRYLSLTREYADRFKQPAQ